MYIIFIYNIFIFIILTYNVYLCQQFDIIFTQPACMHPAIAAPPVVKDANAAMLAMLPLFQVVRSDISNSSPVILA